MVSKGSYRCYEWRYCYPKYYCYIIIAVCLDRHTNVVQSEYYILADNEKIDLIQNPLTPCRIPKYMLWSLIKFKASKEALNVAQGHAKSTIFASHEFGPLCPQNHLTPTKLQHIDMLVRLHHNSNLNKKLLDIENRTSCESLKEALKRIRELGIR